jgi:hypothetical protein
VRGLLPSTVILSAHTVAALRPETFLLQGDRGHALSSTLHIIRDSLHTRLQSTKYETDAERSGVTGLDFTITSAHIRALTLLSWFDMSLRK